MDFPVPTTPFVRYDERKAVVVVDMIDLLQALEEYPAAGFESRILETRPCKVLVQVDGRLLNAYLVRSDTVNGSLGSVERVTLTLPNDRVIVLSLDDARELAPRQAVWSVRYDGQAKVG